MNNQITNDWLDSLRKHYDHTSKRDGWKRHCETWDYLLGLEGPTQEELDRIENENNALNDYWADQRYMAAQFAESEEHREE